MRRVIDRMRKEGMGEDDLKLGEELFYRKATFQMDEYVKLNEVRQIVANALNSLFDKLKKTEEIARKNRSEINSLDAKLKTHQQQVTHLKRVENGQQQLIRMQKEQELRLADVLSELSDMRHKNRQREEVRHIQEQEIEAKLLRQTNTNSLFSQEMAQLQAKF